jgi:SAM-dependent methyltransferase
MSGMGSPDEAPGRGQGYVLGHAEAELRRLAVQAELVDPITVVFLREGGLATGMRVLDVGCGGGHVSFLAAELVGYRGEVVGVDRAATAVAAATAGAVERALPNVSFRQGDPAEMAFDRPFDALIGRYVLQFQPAPADFLRSVVCQVSPGGPVIFHELDWGGPWSFPASPMHDQVCEWAREAIRLSGAETAMGRKLRGTMVAAGLAEPALHLQAVIGGGSNSALPLEQVALLVGSLMPTIVQLGLATPDEIGLGTLLARMTEETLARDSVIIGRLQVGASTVA